MEEKIVESYCREQCDVESNWHDRDCPHEGEVAQLEREIVQLTAENMVLKSRLNPDRKIQCAGCGHWFPIGPVS